MHIQIKYFILVFSYFFIASISNAEIVEEKLTIDTKIVNFAGKDVEALSVNDSIPAPTLRFTEGDTVRIHVKNNLKVNSSIHWHGILLPNNMDGVPNMTNLPIKPGETFTFEFTLRQSGTYWYHSHSGLQEQRGLYGAFIIEPKEKLEIDKIPDYVVVLSDWTNENPHTVLHTLKRGSEWYSIKKKSAQSILGAFNSGMLADYFSRELQRMPPMDISDVFYDAYLLNGKRESNLSPNTNRIRLRVINGSASSIFYTEFAGGAQRVISADGINVIPFDINRLLIGVAESYDIILDLEKNKSLEFRATSHDNYGFSSLWLGDGEKIETKDVPWPNLYKSMHGLQFKNLFALTPAGSMGMSTSELDSKHSMHSHHMHHNNQAEQKPIKQKIKSKLFGLLSEDIGSHKNIYNNPSSERPNSPYQSLKALNKTNFDKSKKIKKIRLTLDGDMERYVWMINNKAMSESDSILIKSNEIVRFELINRTMMYHPMHLHGHFFRVINKHGDYSPLKHTVVIEPMQTTSIEFKATEKGDWFFHCHLLYHMMSGMARMVHYEDFETSLNIKPLQSKLYHDHYYYMGNITGMSNMSQGNFILSNTRNIFSTEWQYGWNKVNTKLWEFTPTYDYYINRFSSIFLGANLDGKDENLKDTVGVYGFRYLLPLNIETRNWLDTESNYQLSLAKSFRITPRFQIYGEGEYDSKTDWEIRSGASYQLSRDWALQTQWHSDFGWGGGVSFSF